ncbi:MAG: bi-domain-containing oxidoreductase [Proteobacteria bacterium]|nr:bi-domain-containing oxidoreductase [Pseudomonadota bacterium]
MKQVTQTLKTGIIEVNNVPIPTLSDKFVLVRNLASVISAGTEKTKIDMGKKNLLQKAKARPDLVKQVIKKVQTEGLAKTWQTVQTRLDSPSPLGYSCAGKVIAVGGLVEGISPGDIVACGGAGYANHAELIAVPRNLVVKVPDGVSNEEGAFATMGAIAMQGVRLAQPLLGETFMVLGLGLIGQLTVQLLRANGCRVIGTDLDDSLVDLAEKYGAKGVRSSDDAARFCKDLSGGHGVDGVIVCAGTTSNGPIELCGEVTRIKGRVVVVGAVGMDIPREPYFKKEISVVISRSYGPGRYDPFYEEGGNDYPIGYVRFTEQRNMESFLGLVAEGKLDIISLITHHFTIDQAPEAYALIEGRKTEPYLGIILTYDDSTAAVKQQGGRIETTPRKIDREKVGISFFGAGNYATASLLPSLKNMANLEFRGLVTASGRTAQGVAKQFGFSFCADTFQELLNNDTDVVMITTRHDSHASSVAAALQANKHVYVEKPLALTVDELRDIHDAWQQSNGAQLMTGYNRRFAPLTKELVNFFSGVQGPLVVNIRINAGFIPEDHWIQDPVVGGGRIIGEGCHFIDLAAVLTGSLPVKVYTSSSRKKNKSPMLNDNVCINLCMENGSIANIIYTADGSKAMAKEYVEIFGGGRSAVLDDFKEARFFEGETKNSKHTLRGQDKGQKDMLSAWINGLRKGTPCLNYESQMQIALATIMAVESMTIDCPLVIDLSIVTGSAGGV